MRIDSTGVLIIPITIHVVFQPIPIQIPAIGLLFCLIPNHNGNCIHMVRCTLCCLRRWFISPLYVGLLYAMECTECSDLPAMREAIMTDVHTVFASARSIIITLMNKPIPWNETSTSIGLYQRHTAGQLSLQTHVLFIVVSRYSPRPGINSIHRSRNAAPF